MGDITLHTPLAPEEAPFVWLMCSAAAVFSMWIPLLAVFHNFERRAEWRKSHNNHVPWLVATAHGTLMFICLSLLFIASSGMSYWTSRGGHEFKHRITVASCQYATLGLVAVWSWVAMFFHSHAVAAFILALAVAGEITFTVFAFHALPLYAGGIGIVAVVALAGMFIAWATAVPPAAESTGGFHPLRVLRGEETPRV